ncbi:MAG: hypothetical protein K0R82_1250 [Flavipsychrobacter sp.]|jgi:hypothetical protein|nr:hypothetical protein [Flavipsychrobacter sp.]
MITLTRTVKLSTGTIEVSWEVHPLHITMDMTSGFLIKNITGYRFPADYFGHLLQLAETTEGYEYMENDIREGRVDADSMIVLDAIKIATVTGKFEE